MNYHLLINFFVLNIPKRKYFLLFLLSVIVTLLEALSITAILPIFFNESNSLGNNFTGIISNFIKSFGFEIFVIIIFTRFFFQSLSIIYETKLISSIASNLQNKIIKNFLLKNILVNENISTIMREVTTDTISVSMIVKHLTIIKCELIVFIILSSFIFINSSLLIIYGICICIFLIVIVFIFFKNKIINYSKKRAVSAKKRISQLDYFLKNFYIIKSIGDLTKTIKIIGKETKIFFKNWQNLIIYINLSKPSVELIFGFIIIIIIIFNTSGIEEGVILSLIALARIIPSVTRISTSFQSLNSFVPLIKNIKKSILSNKNKVNQINPHTMSRGLNILENVAFNYQNKNLSIKYRVKEKNKFYSINLKNNGLICLIGKSGSGKTSFLNDLIINLHVYSGKKFKNRIVSYMPQDINLSNTNLDFDLTSLNNLNNINFKDKNLKILITKLFGEELEKYYNSKQNQFSGGEEKRIGFIRSIIDNPAILILDEPTENLDIKNENMLISEIINESRKRIVIISSHNNSFITNANNLINFDQ